nr:MAG TPA: hypothetical protein [Caudoviricetes sp.]
MKRFIKGLAEGIYWFAFGAVLGLLFVETVRFIV